MITFTPSKVLKDAFLAKSYILLIFLNTLILFGSQYFVYTKHWDFYWFRSFFYRELLLITSYFLAFYVLSFLPKRLCYLFVGVILALSGVCFVIDAFLLHHFDTNLNSYLVIVALETNPQESKDFLKNYLDFPLFGIYTLCVSAIVILWHFIKPIFISPKILGAVILINIAILTAMIFTHTKPLNEDWSDMLYHYAKQIYRAINGTQGFIKEYKELNEKFDSFAHSFEVKPSKHKIQNIVLVIGESTQRDKLSLYSYPLPTTPLLESLKNQKPDNFFIFHDVVASHAQTHESLSLSLTFANQDNTQGIPTLPLPKSKKKNNATPIKEWYEYLNLIDALKLGGYYTISISNQEPVSLFGNAAATILKRADEVEFVNVDDKMSTTKFDENILGILDSLLVSSEESLRSRQETFKSPFGRFFALHLMGNHAKYYNRYPTEFAHFEPKDMLCQSKGELKDSPKEEDLSYTNIIPSETTQENAHYDNSVLYGDFILNEIIRRFEDQDSIVIFFSDHGEEIYDWRSFIGHSDSKISRFMVEIPFIVYVSDEFISKHRTLYNRIKKAQNRRYMNDDLIHSILDIAGVRMKGFESKRSIFSANTTLLNSRKRIVGNASNAKDYDEELKEQKSFFQEGQCQMPPSKQENVGQKDAESSHTK